MGKTLKEILDWSEVWALFIPLIVLFVTKNRSEILRPVRIYLFIALILNIGIDLIAKYKVRWGFTHEDLLWNNNFLYNTGSVIRFFLFVWFFILLRQRFMHKVKIIIPAFFTIFLLINFILFEKFIPRGNYEGFSSRLLATESALLLFYCLQYFIYLILETKTTRLSQERGFWFVTGLSIYVATNFFIYLFYNYLIKATWDFAIGIWDVHNIVFIVFCIFLAKQLSQRDTSNE